MEIDLKRRTVYAKPVKGKVRTTWNGGGGSIHSRILQRMKQVLEEDIIYSYLQSGAVKRLYEVRDLARETGILKTNILPLGGNSYCLLPWLGTVAYRTLERCLRYVGADLFEIRNVAGLSPYFLTFSTKNSTMIEINSLLKGVIAGTADTEQLMQEDEAPQLEKYDEFIPPSLLRKAFRHDYLDLNEVKSAFDF